MFVIVSGCNVKFKFVNFIYNCLDILIESDRNESSLDLIS